MKMLKIDFYYWGSQCPHNDINKKILDAYTNDERYKINYHDISDDFKLAEKMNLFSPTLLVFNDKYRWNGPIKREQIEAFQKDEIPHRKPYKVNQSDNVIKGILKPLDEKAFLILINHVQDHLVKAVVFQNQPGLKRLK